MRILVAGATGYVGSRLVSVLLEIGHSVVVASRSPRRVARYGWADRVEAVRLDVDDPAAIRAAFVTVGDIDVAYYLIHDIGGHAYTTGDRRAAENFAHAARTAGVRRIVYAGGFVPADEQLSPHLRSRAEVGEALAEGAELVWLRAAMILGAGSASFEMMRYLADRLPVVPLPEWVDNVMDPISIRDALWYLVAAADPELLPPGAYDIRGADSSSYRDVLFTYLRLIRWPRFTVTLPGIDTRLAGWLGAWLIPVPTRLAAALIRSLDCPMTVSDDRVRRFVPDPPGGLLTVRQAMAAALAGPYPVPVTELTDVHHLADTDPVWAGGDRTRAERCARRGLNLLLAPVRWW
ncbi:NAD(P)H-binding protein [Nocardia brevicatena]|uniref:NAD(P)H-binding protein n=1 Tax=Nocardia brevicatena TaxID=37327 RepID=UPI000593D111|nr:NAD(P)H-binding protein [Nocardia brevicatena]